MNYLEGLNPKQLEAVQHTEGPLLILAGAGSGKTRVLTHRIAYLIREKGVHPGSILAITFTNKAANEMKERVFRLLGEENSWMWVSTFHSACVRILRQDIEKIGYTRNFVIYDASDQQVLIKDCIREMSLSENNFSPKKVLSLISGAKDRMQGPEEFISDSFDSFGMEQIGRLYRLYQNKLKANNALDFDDIILKTIELFTLHPDVLKFYQNKFRYILVDEYQDTNIPQYRLVHMLSGMHKNLCVVGDDDQSIYKFRGANIGNILDFEKDYPEATVIKLEQNYRSTKNILDAANEVILRNSQRKGKSLWTSKGEGCRVRYRQNDREYQEAEFVVAEVKRLKENEGKKYSDIAVLYRNNAQSRVLEEAFIREGIPHRIVGSLGFYQRKEIKDVVSYLRFIYNPSDDISLKRIVNEPRRGIGDRTLDALEQYASRFEIGLFEAMKFVEETGCVSTGPAKKVSEFVELMEGFISDKDRYSVVALISDVLDRTGYVKALEQEGTIEARGRIENIQELVSAAVQFEENCEGQGTLQEFLEGVALVSDVDNLEEGGGVTLMTLHSAKGLEFPVVFITGMEEGIFPNARVFLDPDEVEEERRLCYVGMTRAEEILYLTWARTRTLYGRTAENLKSRFIDEIPEELLEEVGAPVRAASSRADARTFTGSAKGGNQGYVPGKRIQHRIWGIGTIIKVEDKKDDQEITIAFPGMGVKKLLASMAPIKPL
ncbi:MAG: ATP-dependent DNA helicase UvrD/PcrA [Firmicutes bacterium]|nr:ATP-dependent DNA helicase UvrD/PcrA [Bacillota bacterium]